MTTDVDDIPTDLPISRIVGGYLVLTEKSCMKSKMAMGTTAGLGPEGLLQVEREDGRVVTVIAGDVAEAR